MQRPHHTDSRYTAYTGRLDLARPPEPPVFLSDVQMNALTWAESYAYKDDIWTYLGFLQDRGLKFDEDGNHTEEFTRWLEQYK
eukprot:COSAG05_NODE_14594_length_392_cov_3.542662_2_plen_82_part_01